MNISLKSIFLTGLALISFFVFGATDYFAPDMVMKTKVQFFVITVTIMILLALIYMIYSLNKELTLKNQELYDLKDKHIAVSNILEDYSSSNDKYIRLLEHIQHLFLSALTLNSTKEVEQINNLLSFVNTEVERINTNGGE